MSDGDYLGVDLKGIDPDVLARVMSADRAETLRSQNSTGHHRKAPVTR